MDLAKWVSKKLEIATTSGFNRLNLLLHPSKLIEVCCEQSVEDLADHGAKDMPVDRVDTRPSICRYAYIKVRKWEISIDTSYMPLKTTTTTTNTNTRHVRTLPLVRPFVRLLACGLRVLVVFCAWQDEFPSVYGGVWVSGCAGQPARYLDRDSRQTRHPRFFSAMGWPD